MTDASGSAAFSTRVFLFLEGPASPFLRRVADRLVERGQVVRHVAFCLGDIVFWRVLTGLPFGHRRPAPPSEFWRGRIEDWPAAVETRMRDLGVTDVVMLGDGRPLHAAAIEVAQRSGVRVHVLEHGYVRPDWLTLEPDGMSGASRMPHDPAVLRAMAVGLPAVDLSPRWHATHLRYALYDLAYHLPNVFVGTFVHPRYRTHGPVHPLVEYAGWLWKRARAPLERRHLARTLPAFLDGRRPFFLFPLQLPGDYQILRHAPGGDLFALVDETITSFARAAPGDRHLLFKVHPIDNGLSSWHRRIGDRARELGVGDRVAVVDGGPLDVLLRRTEGVVLVNSTVGTAAIAAGRPLFVLGRAVFEVPGLATSGDLDAFWDSPVPPDGELADAFLRVLVDRIQLRGGFVSPDSVEVGARNVAERLCENGERLPKALPSSRNEEN